MEAKILREIEMVSHIFYGITFEGKLFVQIANSDNEIAYEAETLIEEEPEPKVLMSKLYDLFPDSFKETGIKVSRLNIFPWDGQKIVKSGEKSILDCKTIGDIFPKFVQYLFSFVWENGKF